MNAHDASARQRGILLPLNPAFAQGMYMEVQRSEGMYIE